MGARLDVLLKHHRDVERLERRVTDAAEGEAAISLRRKGPLLFDAI
jgi:hypothetical protein